MLPLQIIFVFLSFSPTLQEVNTDHIKEQTQEISLAIWYLFIYLFAHLIKYQTLLLHLKKSTTFPTMFLFLVSNHLSTLLLLSPVSLITCLSTVIPRTVLQDFGADCHSSSLSSTQYKI